MRNLALLACTTMLAACGGGGPQTIGGSAPPTASGGGQSAQDHSFVSPTQAKTYVGIGGSSVFEYSTDGRNCCGQQQQIFSGNATTARDSSISIAYDPRDAIFTLKVPDALSGAAANARFQDPASRTDFDGDLEPQWGTPELSNGNYRYLQAGDGDPRSPYRVSGSGLIDPGDNDTPPTGTDPSEYNSTSLFYIEPGTETQHVTLAGYARNALSFGSMATGEAQTTYHLERGAFAFGELSNNNIVPITGTGNYEGSMLATMVFNPTLDGQIGPANLPSYFQWIEGTASLSIDFGKNSFDATLNGSVSAPQFDFSSGVMDSVIKEGAAFSASGNGSINLANFGGFKGIFVEAEFVNPDNSHFDVAIEGSSIDGAFYGPDADEVGGGFRIVGGNADERVDILGAFIGSKK